MANYTDFSKTNEEEVTEIVHTSLNHQSNSDDKNGYGKKASFINIARSIATGKSRESSKDDVVTTIKNETSSTSTTTTNKSKRRRKSSWNLVISPRGGVYEQFPVKLYQLLVASEVVGFQDIISWRSHGRSFKVHNPRQFEQEILPIYTRQSKLTSFTRQLNLYGFQRLTCGHDCGAYYHEMFLRNKPLLCRAILRTKIKGTGTAQQVLAKNKKNANKKETKKKQETARNHQHQQQGGVLEETDETKERGKRKQPAKEKAPVPEEPPAPEPDFYNDYPILAPLSYPAPVEQQFYDHHLGAISGALGFDSTKRNIIHVDGSTVVVPDHGVTTSLQENKKARYDSINQQNSGIVVASPFYPPSSHDDDRQYHMTTTTSATVPIVVQSNVQPEINPREQHSSSPVPPLLTHQPVGGGVKFLTNQEEQEKQVNGLQHLYSPQQGPPSFVQQEQQKGFVVAHSIISPILLSDSSCLNQMTTEQSSCTKSIFTPAGGDEMLDEDLDLIKEMVDDDLTGQNDTLLADLTTIMTDFADDEGHAGAITIPSLITRDICNGQPDLNASMITTTDDSNTVMTDSAMETPLTSEPSSPREQMKNDEVCDELLSKLGTLSTQAITNALLIIGWPSCRIDGAKAVHGGGLSHSSDNNKKNSKKCVGRAVTLQFIPARPDIIGDKPADNELRPENEAFEKCGPSEVLVMSSVGKWDSIEGAEMKFLRLLEERHCGGLVTDGSLCEKPIIDDYDFPSFSYEPNTSLPQGSALNMQPWKCNDIVNVGGTSIRPGDIIVGDEHGVVCVPGTVAETVFSIAHGYENNNKVN